MQKALEAVGADVTRTGDPAEVQRARKMVLPGVGAFGACATALRRAGLDTSILEAVKSDASLLGVCVGMQLLFEESLEKGRHKGLGLLQGSVRRFPFAAPTAGAVDLKVPHVGWNSLDRSREHPILDEVREPAYVYYVHSYITVPRRSDDVLARTTYGVDFPAVVGRNSVFGVQFHPEKSRAAGLQILRNYVQKME